MQFEQEIDYQPGNPSSGTKVDHGPGDVGERSDVRELLALSDPDLLIGTSPYPRVSRSEEVLTHPVVRHLAARSAAGQMRDADWVCGTPHVLRAVGDLVALRPEEPS